MTVQIRKIGAWIILATALLSNNFLGVMAQQSSVAIPDPVQSIEFNVPADTEIDPIKLIARPVRRTVTEDTQSVELSWNVVPPQQTWEGYHISAFDPDDLTAPIAQTPVVDSKGSIVAPVSGLSCEKACEVVLSLYKDETQVASDSAFLSRAKKINAAKDGGELTSENSKIKIKYGAGVLGQDLRFYISEHARAGRSLSADTFVIEAETAADGKPVHLFNGSIEISVSYNPNALEGDERSLSLAYLDEETNSWKYLPTTVDTQNHVITARSNHLTVFDRDNNAVDKYKFNDLSAWQTSDFTGAATYSYPINMPAGPGGFTPSLTLNYNSNIPDGGSFYTQASWVGMGWDLEAGSITRNTQGTVDLSDDFFSISFGGAAGILVPLVSGHDNSLNLDYVDYETQNPSFMRIRRYMTRSSASGYSEDVGYWKVWDKTGNFFLFQERMRYSVYGYDPLIIENLKWFVSTATSVSGKSFTFLYDKTYAGRTNQADSKGNPICGACSLANDIEVYLREIRYPNNYFRVVLEREARYDYSPNCFNDQFARCTSDSQRLKRILVKNNADGDAGFVGETIIHKTELNYAANNQQGASTRVFPGVKWVDANGYTSTLLKIQEYGSAGGTLPALEFVYGDRMHLTQVINGYKGKVEFAYETAPWPAAGKATPWPIAGSDIANTSVTKYSKGTALSAGGGGSCFAQWEGLSEGYFSPGKMIGIGLLFGSDGHSGETLTYTIYGPNGLTVSSGAIPLSAVVPNVSEMLYMLKMPYDMANGSYSISFQGAGGGCFLDYVSIGTVVTRYRVTARHVYPDATTTNKYTYTYTYTGPAVNTQSLSYLSTSYFVYDKTLRKPYSEFRGHATVKVTQPDSSYAISTFNQTDRLSGTVTNATAYKSTGTKISESIKTVNTPVQIVTNDNALGYLPSKDGVAFVDAKIWWTGLASSESRTYAPNGTDYLATKTETTYLYDGNGKPVYGLPRYVRTTEKNGSNWDLRTKSFVSYVSNYGIFSDTQYVVGLTNTQATCSVEGNDTTDTPYMMCGSTASNYLSFSQNLYDGLGRVLEVYSLLDFTGAPANSLTNRSMNASKVEYDATFGYVNKSYAGYKIGASAAVYPADRVSESCYGQSTGTTCTSDGMGMFLGWEKNALGQYSRFSYDYTLGGLPASKTDPNNTVTSVKYDQFGRITKVIMSGDTETQPTILFAYFDPPAGNTTNYYTQTSVKRAYNASPVLQTRKVYDGIGRVIQNISTNVAVTPNSTSGTSNVDVYTNYAFDFSGKVTTTTIPAVDTNLALTIKSFANLTSGPKRTVIYDQLGRAVTATDTDGNSTTTSYTMDMASRLMITTTINPENQKSSSKSDIWGNVIQVVAAENTANPITANYVYDSANRMTSYSINSVSGTVTYDNAGRKKSTTDPSMGTWAYTYDLFGNVATQTDALGCKVLMSYDVLNRVKSKAYDISAANCSGVRNNNNYDLGSGKGNVYFTYDENSSSNAGIGHMTKMEDFTGVTYWTYDRRGRVTSESRSLTDRVVNKSLGSYTSYWSYLPDDSVRQMVLPNRNVITYTYDSQGRATSNGYFSSSKYDESGRMVKITLPNSLDLAWSYRGWTDTNDAGRMQRQTAAFTSPAQTVLDLTYDYDKVGNILTIDDNSSSKEQLTFTYDALNRVLSAISTAIQ